MNRIKGLVSFMFYSPGGATIIFVLFQLFFVYCIVLIFTPPKAPWGVKLYSLTHSGSRKTDN